MSYNDVTMDLSGKCNAKCNWCPIGFENRKNPMEMPMMKKENVSLNFLNNY